jgi:hypothetical protein
MGTVHDGTVPILSFYPANFGSAVREKARTNSATPEFPTFLKYVDFVRKIG